MAWLALGALVAAIGATVLIAGYRLVLRDWSRAALAVLVTMLAFYGYGPISAAIDGYWLELSDHGDLIQAPALGYRSPGLLSAALLATIVAAVAGLFWLSADVAAKLTRPLNLASLILVALPAVQLLASSPWSGQRPAAAELTQAAADAGQAESPDIYYIVLDGYARDDVLAEYYGFDNSGFLRQLEELGFSTVAGGHANYYWTFLSLASSLNMDYVQRLLDPLPSRGRDPYEAYESIRDNAVARFLKDHGYRFVQLQSSWGATLTNPYADSLVPCSSSLFTNEFFRAIAEATWLRALSARASADLANCHTTNMESLVNLVPSEGPKFVFAHFVLPHHPYLFDREGRVLKDSTIANQFDFQAKLWEEKDGYIEQLMFVNDRVASILSEILARSSNPPIVLVHSDHGPQLVRNLEESEQRAVRLANFAAFHAPGANGPLIPDGDTPVNYFRRVFNQYFDAGLPLLDNRSFYSSFYNPYRLEEVTLSRPKQ